MRTHRRGWDGVGVWSSHPVQSPQKSNRDSFVEILCVFHWSEEARSSFAKALRSYKRAGCPNVPIDSVDYQKQYRKRAKKAA